MLERSRETLLEAGRPREPALDARLQRRPRLRLAQGLVEQRDRPVEALELGEEGESLGMQRTDVALCQQVREDRAGARPFSGGPMRTGCGQGSTTALVACLRRRQPDRLLGELGRDRRYPALKRERRGVVELGSDLGVGRICRQRKVAGAGNRVVDDRRNASGERSGAPLPGHHREPTTAAGG
jgi:hypothetical protein